jgi:hypothetical protein
VVFIISGVLIVIAISIGLGFALKRKVPELHIIMCLLISFAIVLMSVAAITKELGGFGP